MSDGDDRHAFFNWMSTTKLEIKMGFITKWTCVAIVIHSVVTDRSTQHGTDLGASRRRIDRISWTCFASCSILISFGFVRETRPDGV